MGVFYYVDDVTEAVRALRQIGHRDLRVYSPVPYHDIEKALEQGQSIVRWVTLGGALCGITGGFALCIYSVLSWPLVVGGKELVSLPPFVIIGYESMILLGSLANLFGMLALSRLPEIKRSAPYDPRFTEDRIGVWVPCGGEAAVKAQEMLRGHGAEEVTLHA
jgi:molybdopterin-containing oxidoreductase family membrane subunit